MLHTIIDLAVKIAAGVVAALVTFYTPALVRLIRERVKNATAREALAFVTSVAASQVAARAEEVRTLKDPAKPGQWSPEAGRALLEAAVQEVKRAAPAQVEVLRRGLGNGQNLDELLRTLTEAQVEELRRRPAVSLTTLNTVVAAAPAVRPEDVAKATVEALTASDGVGR